MARITPAPVVAYNITLNRDELELIKRGLRALYTSVPVAEEPAILALRKDLVTAGDPSDNDYR